MGHPRFSNEEIARRGEAIYERQLRDQLEQQENIGKLVVINVETGDFEMDADEVKASRRALEKSPGDALYMKRIGYDAVHGIGASPRRTYR